MAVILSAQLMCDCSWSLFCQSTGTLSVYFRFRQKGFLATVRSLFLKCFRERRRGEEAKGGEGKGEQSKVV